MSSSKFKRSARALPAACPVADTIAGLPLPYLKMLPPPVLIAGAEASAADTCGVTAG